MTIHSSRNRQRLRTEAAGTVHIRLGILLRNLEKFGVEVGRLHVPNAHLYQDYSTPLYQIVINL